MGLKHLLLAVTLTSGMAALAACTPADEPQPQEQQRSDPQRPASVGRGWPVPELDVRLPRGWRLEPGGRGPSLARGDLPEGIEPLARDIFVSDDFYVDRELWSDPRYFRCLSAQALEAEASLQTEVKDPALAPWGYCEHGYAREGIVSPYSFKTAREHYEALLAEATSYGGPTVHTRMTLPEWDGRYTRNVLIAHVARTTGAADVPPEFAEPPQWIMGPYTQIPTTLSLLTPEYQQRFVQLLYHEGHSRAPQWAGMYCRPEGFMRQWMEQGGPPMDLTLTPDRMQLLAKGTDNIIRNFNFNRRFNLEGSVPYLGEDVRSWYGESIGFWDDDALITWTSNIQGWMTHGSFENSSQLQTIEIFTPRKNSAGDYIGLDHETVFYDEEALVEPVRQVRFLSKSRDLSEATPYTYVHCNQTIFAVDGRGIPVSPGTVIEYKVEDLYGRPWAAVWEEWFEKDMQRPEREKLFGF
jgi:hypothetical protein